MHRRYVLLLAVGLVLVTVPGLASADTGFSAIINAAQELSCAINSTATGSGTFVLNNAQTELTYNITYSGLQGAVTVAHFHNAPAGVGGGVVRGFSPVTSPIVGIWKNTDAQPLTAAMVTELLNARIYVNIHSTLCTGGEIRGQVLLDATPARPTTWGRIKTIYR
jgi:hypothetical protein